ncbi:MAG: hypothetical protein ACI4QA_08150 [Candidatus Spyradosoma sp.]
MRRRLLPLAAFLATAAGTLLPTAAHAVAVRADKLPQNAFVVDVAEPHQVFTCRDARKITHVSLQKYVSAQPTEGSRLNAPPQYVTEMTIDFESMPGQVRVYAMEEFDPLRFAEKIGKDRYDATKKRSRNTVNALSKSNAADVAQYLVVKTYPQTTHAKTIEFRVAESAEVEELFKLFTLYYRRDRKDYRYFGAIASENAKTRSEDIFLNIKRSRIQGGSPEGDWKDAYDKGAILRDDEKIIVSGLSGLRFTLGEPSVVASEIETRDVNRN